MSNQNHNKQRPRVLMVAYACSPKHGSDPGVGWNRALQAAKHFDTWVLCQENQFGPVIRDHLTTHGDIPGLHFEFVPEKPAAGVMWSIPGLGWLSYNLWHRRALRVARRLHEEVHFDLAHQATVISFREPGYAWKLGIPFVWGPVGGTHAYPWRFLAEAGLVQGALELARNLVNAAQLRLCPRVRRAAREASALLAANSTIQRDLAALGGTTPSWLPELGITKAEAPDRRQRAPETPLRILWSGELRARKALSLLIKALGRLPKNVSYEVRVLGCGPLQSRWCRLARREGVDAHIQWMGQLPLQEALNQRDWADLFVFSSLRDTTGTVVLEALLAGLPVVCLDHQGVGDVVTEECGMKIPVTTPREVVRGLADAIETLAEDPRLLERLSDGAIRRAQQYSWDWQGEQMASVYRDVTGTHATPTEQSTHTRDSEPRTEHVAPNTPPALPERGSTEPVASPALMLPADAGCEGGLLARMSKRCMVLRVLSLLSHILRSRNDASFSILMYHRVAPHTQGASRPTCNVTPTRFRSQLEGLLKRGYKAWPLEKLIEHSEQGRPIPAKTFAVTFDDGYENVYSEAWPILQEFDIPATVFVATNYLDSQDPFPFDLWAASGSKGVPVESWRPLSTAQCHEMLDSGTIEIGTHTHTHHDFRNRPGAFREDMLASLDFLRERFGLSNPTFALPYGLWQPDHGGQTLNTIARDVGVRCCLTTVEEEVASGSNPYGWGRVEVTNSDTASTLIARMEGWYGAVRRAWKNTCRIVKWPLKRERSPLPLPAGLSQQSKPSYPTARS